MSGVESTRLFIRRHGDNNLGASSARVTAMDPLGTQPFRPSLVLTFRGHRSSVLAAGFQSSATPVAERRGDTSGGIPPYTFSCGADGYVFLWGATSTTRELRFVGHRGPVYDAAWNPQAQLIASAGHDGFVRLWLPSLRRSGGMAAPSTRIDVDGNCCVWRAHGGPVRALATSPSGDLLYTAGDDKSVKCWDLNHASTTLLGGSGGSKFVCGFTGGHQNWVRTVAVSRGSSGDGGLLPTRVPLIASGGDDRTVLVWDTRSRRPTHSFFEHTNAVRSVDFHPDGCSIATGSADHTINVFDLRKNRLLQHYDAHDGAVNEVRFAPAGSWLLSASADSSAKLWDLKEGYLYCTLNAHKGAVHTARFSDDGACFTTAGQDGIVMLWRSGLPRVPSSYATHSGAHFNQPTTTEKRQWRSQSPATTGAATTFFTEATPRGLAASLPTTPRAGERGRSYSVGGRAETAAFNDLYCSIETSENQHSENQTEFQIPNGAPTGTKLQGNMPSSVTSPLPFAISSQKPPLARPSSRGGVGTPSSFVLPDTNDNNDDNDAQEGPRKVGDRGQGGGPSDRCSSSDAGRSFTSFHEGKEQPCFLFEQSHFLQVGQEDGKTNKAGNEKENWDNRQVLNGPASASMDISEHRDFTAAVGSGEIDDVMSVMEYVGRTCDEGDGGGWSDGSARQPGDIASVVAYEKDGCKQTTSDRLSRLEEVCARLTAAVQVVQERSTDLPWRLQKQWEAQQNEMDELRQMMKSLVAQQGDLLQALRKE